MSENELLELKVQIDQAKEKLSELKGRKQILMDTLEKEWGCKTVKQAERRMNKVKQEKEALKEEEEKGIKELEENYDF